MAKKTNKKMAKQKCCGYGCGSCSGAVYGLGFVGAERFSW